MDNPSKILPEISDCIGKIPYRMAFAGGWIDQPFVSRRNPHPPGSMVVVSLLPTVRFMERCGMGTSTRKIARNLWGDELPGRNPVQLMHELYAAENDGKKEPSGSQDMAGIIFPGINRLDYDSSYEDGYFPVHIESNHDAEIAAWLEKVIYLIPINQRPPGYSPLDEQYLNPEWVEQLGLSGKECYSSILARDVHALGTSMNRCMDIWEKILPNTVRHPSITIDLLSILNFYQKRYAGAMFSGCGGGYLYVVSDEPVPGAFQVSIRIRKHGDKGSEHID